jgi:hypothetical protein
MIFDSSEMAVLHKKYRKLPNYEVPEIVFLDRYDGYAGERILLEELIASVSKQKQKDWLGRLVNEIPSQHIGVWFEIMLFGWLKEHFTVQVEPEILGNYPDFILEIQNKQLAIESRAFLIPPDERERISKFNRIMSSLGSIEKPFSVNLKIRNLGNRIIIKDFIGQVVKWLDANSTQDIEYRDGLGNILKLSATSRPTLKKVGAYSSEGLHVNPDVLKSALTEKARQHKALRNSGYPYIIAIFLEPSHLSAEEVVGAWIGRTVVVYDIERDQVVEEKFDESGIRFFGKEVVHKSVTGVLVFKAGYDESRRTRYLQSWYVQNPHANIAIDPNIFPVESRFVVVGQDDKMFEMRWIK